MTRLLTIALALALAIAAIWYHRHVVAGYRAEIDGMRTAAIQAQIKAATAALTITTDVLTEREEQHAEIHDARQVAAVAVATATSQPGEVDADALVPAALSDALLVQHERVCAGAVRGVSAGGIVPSQAAAGASGEGG